MKKSLIEKLKVIISHEKNVSEDEVRSFMIITRKILDKMDKEDPYNYQNKYLTLRLFCNWSAHIEITNSNIGLRILAKINETLLKIKDFTDDYTVNREMSQSIGFTVLKKELIAFLKEINISDVSISKNELWTIYLNHLIEIIKDTPISFPPLSTLEGTKLKIYNQISQNSIIPGFGIVSMQISLLHKLGEDEAMSLLVKTENNSNILFILIPN